MPVGFQRGEAPPDQLHPLITKERQSGNAYYVSMRHFPTDDVDVVALRLGPGETLRGGGGAARKNVDKAMMDESTLRKSQRRAAQAVRRKALTMQADRMLTLTFRENLTDRQKAWDVFKYFSRLMRWRFADRWVYITVQEYQKRGAIHFHLAIKGYFPVSSVRDFWSRAVGALGGNIDITSPKAHGKNSWNPRRVAQYLAKYMTKQDIAAFNERRYSTGGDIQIPEPVTGWLCVGCSVVQILRQVIESRSRLQINTAVDTEAFWPVVFLSTS